MSTKPYFSPNSEAHAQGPNFVFVFFLLLHAMHAIQSALSINMST